METSAISILLSALIVVAGMIASYAIMKNNLARVMKDDEKQTKLIAELEKFKNENTPLLAYLVKACDEVKDKQAMQAEAITTLKEKVGQAPTMKEVRDEFVSKEMFMQMQKHIDEKFTHVEAGIDKILTKLDSKA